MCVGGKSFHANKETGEEMLRTLGANKLDPLWPEFCLTDREKVVKSGLSFSFHQNIKEAGASEKKTTSSNASESRRTK